MQNEYWIHASAEHLTRTRLDHRPPRILDLYEGLAISTMLAVASQAFSVWLKNLWAQAKGPVAGQMILSCGLLAVKLLASVFVDHHVRYCTRLSNLKSSPG